MDRRKIIYMDDVIEAVEKNACNTQRIMDAVNNLPSVQPEQRWIPCSERLPDVNGWYVTTISGEICGQDRAFSGMSEFANGKWMSGDDVDETEMTIAWMPLPEPYKAESYDIKQMIKDGIVISRNLCDSCINNGCIFQSGIVRNHCDFYKAGRAERKKGRWIRNDNGTYSCSICQSWIPDEQHYYANYCLYCGADMRGETE